MSGALAHARARRSAGYRAVGVCPRFPHAMGRRRLRRAMGARSGEGWGRARRAARRREPWSAAAFMIRQHFANEAPMSGSYRGPCRRTSRNGREATTNQPAPLRGGRPTDTGLDGNGGRYGEATSDGGVRGSGRGHGPAMDAGRAGRIAGGGVRRQRAAAVTPTRAVRPSHNDQTAENPWRQSWRNRHW